MLTFDQVKAWLRPIDDPEMRMSLVDLGLIYGAEAKAPGVMAVRMSLTSPACPAAGHIVDLIKQRLLEHVDIQEAFVEVVFEPKWDPKTMASEEVRERLGLW